MTVLQVHTGGMGQKTGEKWANRRPKGAANSIHYSLLAGSHPETRKWWPIPNGWEYVVPDKRNVKFFVSSFELEAYCTKYEARWGEGKFGQRRKTLKTGVSGRELTETFVSKKWRH